MKAIDREILRIALPSIVSNITVPLLGLVDVTIVGHLGSPAYIGAIAVGGLLFNIIYWIFGFLRMGTSGMTSQAYGRQDQPEMLRLLVRAVGLGVLIAVLLVILQVPIAQGAFLFIHPTEEIRELATTYFRICIWGAPAMLGLYGLTGWYIGMQNSRIPMAVAITQNVVNIAASLSFVYWGGMKMEGVALGTLVAQWAGFGMGLALWFRQYGYLRRQTLQGLWQREAMKRFFGVNRDIFLRTLCLVAVTADAALHAVLLRDGRFCLRGRGTEREVYRCQRRYRLPQHSTQTVRLGSGHGHPFYRSLCTGRKRFPKPPDG